MMGRGQRAHPKPSQQDCLATQQQLWLPRHFATPKCSFEHHWGHYPQVEGTSLHLQPAMQRSHGVRRLVRRVTQEPRSTRKELQRGSRYSCHIENNRQWTPTPRPLCTLNLEDSIIEEKAFPELIPMSGQNSMWNAALELCLIKKMLTSWKRISPTVSEMFCAKRLKFQSFKYQLNSLSNFFSPFFLPHFSCGCPDIAMLWTLHLDTNKTNYTSSGSDQTMSAAMATHKHGTQCKNNRWISATNKK